MTSNYNYRGYFYTNSYLSGLQKGLQTAHCVATLMRNADYSSNGKMSSTVLRNADYSSNGEMSSAVLRNMDYSSNGKMLSAVLDWAEFDKTIIILDGGNHHDLNEIRQFFSNQTKYAWDSFHEDHQSLNGAITAVGIILPEKIYSELSINRDVDWNPTSFEPAAMWNGWKDHITIEPFTKWECEFIKQFRTYRLSNS